MSSESFGDPPRNVDRSRVHRRTSEIHRRGHPVSSGSSLDPDAPSLHFTVQTDIFEGYLLAEGVEPEGDD